ncbi:MAG: hypothetical protein WBO07_04835 [Formosimonas sp.]
MSVINRAAVQLLAKVCGRMVHSNSIFDKKSAMVFDATQQCHRNATHSWRIAGVVSEPLNSNFKVHFITVLFIREGHTYNQSIQIILESPS